MVSARVSDLGFGQFELKKLLAETETPAETETLAKTSKTGRNRSKPAESPKLQIDNRMIRIFRFY
jgi:hypothetical protein